MTPKDSKKTADHGVLCGLRSDTPADSSKRFRASLTKEPAKEPEFAFTPSPRPESLTLPFQNRERASHLITDEDMDRIMRQGELDDPMPRLPSTVSGNLTGLGLRRTLSTAQDLGVSLFTHRPRPASAHFGGTDLEGSASNTRYERSRYSRDPTLTALPRPPTKNDMAVYPSQTNIVTSMPSLAQAGSLQNDNINIGPRSQTPANSTNITFGKQQGQQGQQNRQVQQVQQGHKRKLSLSIAASNVFESVKKRMKRSEQSAPSDMSISNPSAFNPPSMTQGVATTETEVSSGPSNIGATAGGVGILSGNRNDSDTHPDLQSKIPNPPKRPSKPLKPSTTKKILRRSWSFTKDAAKETFDFINPLPRITRIKEPEFEEVFPPSRRPAPTPATVAPTTLTARASAPNLQTPTRAPPTMGTYPPPSPRRPEPWETAPREVIGVEIKRLENRITQLRDQNEAHSREIKFLRARNGQLEDEAAMSRLWIEQRQQQGQEEEEEEEGGEGEGEGEGDKRRTWMTCESE